MEYQGKSGKNSTRTKLHDYTKGILYTRLFLRDFIAIKHFVYYNVGDYNKLDKGAHMEYSIMLWNKIAEMLESIGLPHVSESQAIMVFAAAFLVLLLLLWLIFRNLRLWYWKTNIQIKTLRSIDDRLQSVEERLASEPIRVVAATEPVRQEEKPETTPECRGAAVIDAPTGQSVVGRSGRVYTEAELELQIRD